MREADVGGGAKVRTRRGRLVKIALILVSSACESLPTFPEVEVARHLAWLEGASTRHDEKLAVLVRAELMEGPSLAPGEFVSVTLRSTSGNEAEMRLSTAVCVAKDGARLCRELWVWLEDGHDLRELEPLLRRFDAQLTSVQLGSPIGRVYAFGDFDATINALRGHDAVRFAEVLDVDLTPAGDAMGFLSGAVRTTADAAAPGFLLAHGDTITAIYVQPDGSTVTASGHVVRCVNLLSFCSWGPT